MLRSRARQISLLFLIQQLTESGLRHAIGSVLKTIRYIRSLETSLTRVLFFNRYTIMEHTSEVDGFSRFSISPVLDQDEGQITCEASNRFGRDQKHFSLSIEGTKLIRWCNYANCSVILFVYGRVYCQFMGTHGT